MGLAIGGGKGSGGGTTKAVTRLAVVDPHLVIMMRDVMDASETAARLQVGGGAGGGGGGSAEDDATPTSGAGGINGSDGVDVPSAINLSDGADGLIGAEAKARWKEIGGFYRTKAKTWNGEPIPSGAIKHKR